MNLFALGYGLNGDRCDRISRALTETASLYSSLDKGETYAWQSSCRRVALACRYPAKGLRGPREYVAETDDIVFAYDGLPVDSNDQFMPHIATELANNWDDSAHDLDGFFCGIRILKQKLQVELQLDSFGVHPIYYWNDNDTWLISNSIALLDQLTGGLQLDPVGVGRFLAMGWVAGNRTLREGVRVFPAGERWTWEKEGGVPSRMQTTQYLPVVGSKNSKLTRSSILKLGDDLARPLKSLYRNLGNLSCPLTGGKDSRMLAALLARNNVSARHYTYGNKVGVDGEIAEKVAAELGVPHENLLTDSADLLADWNGEVEKFILQGDGMSPLQLVMSNMVAEKVATRPLSVRISGGGGALGRAQYFNPIHDFRGATVRNVQDNIAKRFVSDSAGMIRPEAVAMARTYTDRAISRYADHGFHIDDLNDIFYLYERGGRRTGQVMHPTMHLRDSYSPYFSRALVEAIFSVKVRVRRTEAIHYQLMETLAPTLLQIPFESGPWKSRLPNLNFYQELTRQVGRRLAARLAQRFPRSESKAPPQHFIVKDSTFERVKWLQQIQSQLRDMCLDTRNSLIWDFVDRTQFEAAMASTSSLSRYARPLFLTATIHYYEMLSERRRSLVNSE